MKRLSGDRGIKRPIAELLMMTLNPGAEADRAHVENEAWQILRRKQGYITHRIYQHLTHPLQRLVYSEWENAKAVDGARQYLQGTPMMRRGRAALATAPQRLVLELAGPITSTKGIDLPEDAVAVCVVARAKTTDGWREKEHALWKALAGQAGHISHVLLRSTEDPFVVGSLSHWESADAFHKGLAQVDASAAAGVSDALASLAEYVIYRPLRA